MNDPRPTAQSPRGGDPGLSSWPALVLTAGLGTRLRPLSLVRAKAALPVGDDVLVRHVLRWLHSAGIRRVVLNLHHRPETITPYVGEGSDLGLGVRYSWESSVLGSAGGPRRALPLLDAERFLIVNGDTLTDASLHELTSRHVATGAQVTMTVTDGDARYGGVFADDTGVVHGFSTARSGGSLEPPPAGLKTRPYEQETDRFHFVGIQAVERRVFEHLPDDVRTETVHGFYPDLAQTHGAIRIYRTGAVFHDIGTPADYLATARQFAGHNAPLVGLDTRVDPSARLDGSILWDRVTVGAGAELTDCVVADDVTIAPGARHHRQAIVEVDGKTIVTAI